MKRERLARRIWARLCFLPLVLLLELAPAMGSEPPAPSSYTPLVPLTQVQVLSASPAFPGGRHEAGLLVDGHAATEYAANGTGLGTFVSFDFGRSVAVRGLRHVDRNDPATVAQSELVFSDQADFASPVARFTIDHPATPGATTNFLFSTPVTARYARWTVTKLGPQGHGTVGGAEFLFFEALTPDAQPSRDHLEVTAWPAVVREQGQRLQPLQVKVTHPYAEPVAAKLLAPGSAPLEIQLDAGTRSWELGVPPVQEKTPLTITLEVAGKPVTQAVVELRPVRAWELALLPHSHVDIGFTHVQTEVEQKQWHNLEQAVELVRQTASNPPEARFKWSSEVLWAVDSYLKQAPPEKRQALVEAIRQGGVELNGLYGNELTALCRPEELMRLLDCAQRLRREYGFSIDSAMISDVPGYTWGIVPTLAQNGIRYFSVGPNHIHRIGRTLSEWGDRPFYWISPSGQEKILCWVAGHGYAGFHSGLMGNIEKADPGKIMAYLDELEAHRYPYDLVQLRYTIGGDNGTPDPELADFVMQWNAHYERPKLRIATATEICRDLEQRYGPQIPEFRGDFTPYWEDGAASSARETALARMAAERLVQAETLWGLLQPAAYPDGKFYDAWRNVILYNEHTWGAYCSIDEPEAPLTKAQWAIKQAFAVDADRQAQALLQESLAGRRASQGPVAAIDVLNTTSWPRTDLVQVPREMAVVGDAVRTVDGQAVPSQRLADGSLAVWVENVPAFGAKRLLLAAGAAAASGSAKAEEGILSSKELRVVVDPKTGAIASLVANGITEDLVDAKAGAGLNEYYYVAGRKATDPQRNGPVRVKVEDAGPLVASLMIESAAPGCQKLVRRLQVVDRLGRVDISNVVDKTAILSKESVHFGFAAHVPEGTVRMDMPWSIVRPEIDQLCGACKNYLTVGRWIDVSNAEYGLTWATLDAPLVELGRISVDVASPFVKEAFLEHLEPTQSWFSYVMNNYWETNYKASQEGPTTFRYALWPHRSYDQAASARFGIEQSQPLVVVPVAPETPALEPRLRVEPAGVVLATLRPSDDGHAVLVRLFNAAATPQKASLEWTTSAPSRVCQSSPRQEAGVAVRGPIELPALGIVTLRAEWK